MNKHKYLIYFTIGLLGSMYSCTDMRQGNEQRPSNTPDSIPAIKATTDTTAKDSSLITERINLKQVIKGAETNIEIDYPVAGNKVLVNSIYDFINEHIKKYFENAEGNDPIKNYEGSFDDKGSFLKHYTFEIQKNLKSWNEDDQPDSNYYAEETFNKVHETKKYVSFSHKHTIYTGGAHGSWLEEGISIRKADGKKFGWELMKDIDSPEFKQVLKEGTRKYFEEIEEKKINDEDLDNHFFSGDADNLPLPNSQPYFTEKGIEIRYATYEVAAYVYGSPNFVLPYSEAKKFLKDEALDMVKE